VVALCEAGSVVRVRRAHDAVLAGILDAQLGLSERFYMMLCVKIGSAA
jgi:hypothetical protein